MPNNFKQILPGDGECQYFKSFIAEGECAHYLKYFITKIDWRHDPVTVFGKSHMQPRLTAWYGDAGANYTYSGLTLKPTPWTASLLTLKATIEKASRAKYNSVLLNYYRDGNDYMGKHSDKEKALGETPTIASLSFGEERIFRLRHRKRDDLKPIDINVQSGDLILMKGSMQQNWTHEIVKTALEKGPRINLSFRFIYF